MKPKEIAAAVLLFLTYAGLMWLTGAYSIPKEMENRETAMRQAMDYGPSSSMTPK